MPTTLVPTFALTALALATAAETADATTEPSTTELVADAAAFKKAARPLIREYIFSDYASFAAGELTFRTLKTHLSEAPGLPYKTSLRRNTYCGCGELLSVPLAQARAWAVEVEGNVNSTAC